MIELKKITAKFDGKCVRCGMEIKPGHEYYFAPVTATQAKAGYCLQCGDYMMNMPNDDEIPENLNIVAAIGDMSLKMEHFFTHFQVVHADDKSMRERLSEINDNLIKMAEDLETIIQRLSETAPEKTPETKTKKK